MEIKVLGIKEPSISESGVYTCTAKLSVYQMDSEVVVTLVADNEVVAHARFNILFNVDAECALRSLLMESIGRYNPTVEYCSEIVSMTANQLFDAILDAA